MELVEKYSCEFVADTWIGGFAHLGREFFE
jgi:hypothetical protein